MRTVILIVAASLLVPVSAPAQVGPSGPAEETVELPDLQVIGKKQELALRFVKAGLEADRSLRHEDSDKPYCWFDQATGSHMTYLYCGLNRSLNDSGRHWRDMFVTGVAASGTLRGRRQIMRSNFPVNRAQMQKIMDRLGPSALNEEILERGLRGEDPPDDVPSEREVDRFARALAEVRKIREGHDGDAAEAESRMVAAIRNAELTVERYNRISDLVERYESLQEMVKERL